VFCFKAVKSGPVGVFWRKNRFSFTFTFLKYDKLRWSFYLTDTNAPERRRSFNVHHKRPVARNGLEIFSLIEEEIFVIYN